MNIRKLIKKLWDSSTFTTWGNLLTSSLKLLIITPLLVIKLNTQEISMWYLFVSYITILILFDFGFMPTFSRLVAYVKGGINSFQEFKEKKPITDTSIKWELMNRLYGNIGIVYLFIAVVGFIIFSSVGSLTLIKAIRSTPNPTESWIAWSVICFCVPLLLYFKRFDSVLIGLNYVALVNRWNILFNSLTSILLLITLILYPSILLLVIVSQLLPIMNGIRNRYLLLNVIQDKKFKKFKSFHYDKEIMSFAWGPAWRSALGILGSTGITQSTGIIYSQINNSYELASYLFSLRLFTVLYQFSQAPFYSKIPIFARLRAENNLTELAKRTKKGMTFSLLIFAVFSVIIIYAGNPVLEMIGANTRLMSKEFLMLFCFTLFLERHHAMHAQIYSTTNHIPFYIPIIISGIINIVIIYLTIGSLGVWAFPVGLLSSNLLINNWWNVKISLKSINKSLFDFSLSSFIIPLLLFISLLLLFYYLKVDLIFKDLLESIKNIIYIGN